MEKNLNYTYNYIYNCYGQNICIPSIVHVEILMPDVMMLAGGTFGRCLSHESGTLINVISAF